jgi:hypothetical protein
VGHNDLAKDTRETLEDAHANWLNAITSVNGWRSCGLVEGSFFSILGLNPTIGRLIGPDDDHASQPSPVAVLELGLLER